MAWINTIFFFLYFCGHGRSSGYFVSLQFEINMQKRSNAAFFVNSEACNVDPAWELRACGVRTRQLARQLSVRLNMW